MEQTIDDLHWSWDAWEFDIIFNYKGKWSVWVCQTLAADDFDDRDEAAKWILSMSEAALIELISRAERQGEAVVIGKKNYHILSEGNKGYFIRVGKGYNIGIMFKDGKVRDWAVAVGKVYKSTKLATNECLFPSREEAQSFIDKCLAAKRSKRPVKKEGLKEVFRVASGFWTDTLTPDVPYLYLNKTTNTYHILYWVNKWFGDKWSGGGWYKNPLDKLPSYDWDGRNERVWELPGVKYDAPIAYSNKRQGEVMRLTKNNHEINTHYQSNQWYVVKRTNRREGNYFLCLDGKLRSMTSLIRKHGAWDKGLAANIFPTKEDAEAAVHKYLSKQPVSKNKLIKEKIGKIKQWLDELNWSKKKELPDHCAANFSGWPLSDGRQVSLANLVYDLIDTAGIGDFPPCDDKEFNRRMRLNEKLS